MNPSICQYELEIPQATAAAAGRPPDFDKDRFIAIVGGAFTGVRIPHRILLPRLTNAVYGRIPDNPDLPEDAIPFHGEVVCGTRQEIVDFQVRSTNDALDNFAQRTELWADNDKFQEDLRKKGVNSFILGLDSRISVDESSPDVTARPGRQPKEGAALAPADVEFIRKIFMAAFPGRTFTVLEMAEALFAYHNQAYKSLFATRDD